MIRPRLLNLSFRDLPRAMVVYITIIFAVMYLIAAIPRVLYPYDLDYAEDGTLMQAWQFAQGLPVFVPPNADFVPQQYTPLYTWLGGELFKITGPAYVPLRLLSLASVFVTTALIFFIARGESGEWWLAVACAGLFLGGYRLTGFWYELARVDSLFVALSLAGMTLAIYARGRAWRMLASAFLLALAFWTKQTALIFGIAIALFYLLRDGRRASWYIVPYILFVAAPILILNVTSGGWFWFYAFIVFTGDPFEIRRALNFLILDFIGAMVGAAGCALAALYVVWRNARTWNVFALIPKKPWLFMIVVGIFVSAVGRAPVSGSVNNLMPVFTLVCLAPALLAREWSATLDAFSAAPVTLGTVELMVALAILFQFSINAYNPFRAIPTSEMRTRGAQLIQRLASTEGEVDILMHPYYARLANKKPSAQIATLWYAYARGKLSLPDDFVERLNSKYYAAIISDESAFETDPAIRNLLTANYPLSQTLNENESPATDTGTVVRPTLIYLTR